MDEYLISVGIGLKADSKPGLMACLVDWSLMVGMSKKRPTLGFQTPGEGAFGPPKHT